MTGDPSLTDDALQDEIDLVGALVLEASASTGPMSQERIDEILGVDGEGSDDEGSDGEGSDADGGGPEGSGPG
ncbi:hypothetical protein [Phycicoccus sonneratiae]|uniref:Uncharacterized protein n=1 Tax=Phycicoccus sonneratiae TaxID=2807628 RepID=A0ABS2CQZ3_9MICO|nr:hypothetical protein [Phycicoccus sonneraticus]MBM6402304.1 hypothetical protein [Phycicoccus sonneraticus]